MQNDDDRQACEALLDSVLGTEQVQLEMGKFANATVESAEIDGDQATVDSEDITGVIDGDIGTIELIRVDGAWWVEEDFS